MIEEVWKEVPGYGGHYEASNLGKIRSKDRIVYKKSRSGKIVEQFYKGKNLSLTKSDKEGYRCVHIGLNSKKYKVSVHKIILITFVGPKPEGMECCHNNGICDDNRVENLRWDTHSNNNRDRIKHDTYSKGECHHMAKYTDEVVVAIKNGLLSVKDAKKIYGISHSHVWRIKTGESWKHLNGVQT